MPELSVKAEDIAANTDAMRIYAEDKRHYQMATFTVMVIFFTANTALFLPLEFIEKVFGPLVVSFMGLSSVLISVFSAIEPRRSWFRAMRKGYETQEWLKERGIQFATDPFGSAPARGGLQTTHLVHLVVGLSWVVYLLHHYTVSELILKLYEAGVYALSVQ